MLVVAIGFALASATGQSGLATTGCTTCHGIGAASDTSASFSPAPVTVAPNDRVPLSFTVGNPRELAAGLDIAASGGGFIPGSNTQVLYGDVTHRSPTPMTAGTTVFDFSWVAPDAEGTFTLSGAGNAVDLDNQPTANDAWNLAPDLVILVDDGCEDLDGDGYGARCGEDCDETDPTVGPCDTGPVDTADSDSDTGDSAPHDTAETGESTPIDSEDSNPPDTSFPDTADSSLSIDSGRPSTPTSPDAPCGCGAGRPAGLGALALLTLVLADRRGKSGIAPPVGDPAPPRVPVVGDPAGMQVASPWASAARRAGWDNSSTT